jgi:hypothetical protein
MANEEARAMLDALMGPERNASLPPGAAVPSKRKNTNDSGNGGGALLLPGKRQKSCFDKDIDPLYTAWGVDVYDLFVNTKSDVGTNPYIVDAAAHREFQQLTQEQQERTGYFYFLFQKLQELVRQCDRTVARSKEKLAQELQRKLGQRGGQDFVEDVDQAAVESLVRAMWQVEDLSEEWTMVVQKLDQVSQDAAIAKEKLETLLQARKAAEEQRQAVQDEEEKKKQETATGETEQGEHTANSTILLENQVEVTDIPVPQEAAEDTAKGADQQKGTVPTEESPEDDNLNSLQMNLGMLTLQKQRLVFDVCRIMTRLVPLQESIESQHRTLNYVKSDISTDKTVCEVSGNFMSSRDADERIAAHYAGKQYVGWRLVRDKFQHMVQHYGRYGPPPPAREAPQPQRVLPPSRTGGSFGGGSSDRRDGNFQDRGRFNDGGGYRGGGGGDSRWERHGPPPGGGYQDRGGRVGPPRDGSWRR